MSTARIASIVGLGTLNLANWAVESEISLQVEALQERYAFVSDDGVASGWRSGSGHRLTLGIGECLINRDGFGVIPVVGLTVDHVWGAASEAPADEMTSVSYYVELGPVYRPTRWLDLRLTLRGSRGWGWVEWYHEGHQYAWNEAFQRLTLQFRTTINVGHLVAHAGVSGYCTGDDSEQVAHLAGGISVGGGFGLRF